MPIFRRARLPWLLVGVTACTMMASAQQLPTPKDSNLGLRFVSLAQSGGVLVSGSHVQAKLLDGDLSVFLSGRGRRDDGVFGLLNLVTGTFNNVNSQLRTHQSIAPYTWDVHPNGQTAMVQLGRDYGAEFLLYDCRSWKELRKLPRQGDNLVSRYLGNGSFALVIIQRTGPTDEARIYDTSSWKEKDRFEVVDVGDFIGGGKLLTSRSDTFAITVDNHAYIYDRKGLRRKLTFAGEPSMVQLVEDGKQLISARRTDKGATSVETWSTEMGAKLSTQLLSEDNGWPVGASNHSGLMACVYYNRLSVGPRVYIGVYDLVHHENLRNLTSYNSDVTVVRALFGKDDNVVCFETWTDFGSSGDSMVSFPAWRIERG
jgi:hypothetical protein